MLTKPRFPPQDFGDYQDGYYSVQTTEGEQIAQLIAGYIDIILKKVKNFPSCRLCFSPRPSVPSQEGQLGLRANRKSAVVCETPQSFACDGASVGKQMF